MTHRVRRFDEPAAFLARAEPWLLRAEAEHNLVLGLAHHVARSPDGFEPPFLFATVEADDDVVGCVFRTPPFKLGVTRMPETAMPAVVEAVAGVYAALPAVLGPESSARRFAELWCRRTGGVPREGMRQRVYELTEVVPPPTPSPGRLRGARADDLDLIVEWVEAFSADAGIETPDVRRLARSWIEAGEMVLWEDDGPKSMARVSGATPNGIRVGHVYTPPRWRGRGYASAAVAELSLRQLREGRRFCFLYTDVSNPTSNAIYRRIGYRPVCDVVDVHLDAEQA